MTLSLSNIVQEHVFMTYILVIWHLKILLLNTPNFRALAERKKPFPFYYVSKLCKFSIRVNCNWGRKKLWRFFVSACAEPSKYRCTRDFWFSSAAFFAHRNSWTHSTFAAPTFSLVKYNLNN